MKILIYGENWEGTLPFMLGKAFREKNFQVENFDFTELLPGIRTRSLWQIVKRKLFLPLYIMKIRRKMLERCQLKFDIVLVCKGLHLDRSTLLKIKSNSTLLINWNPDDFFNMKNSSPSLIEAMAVYDLIVSSRPHLFSEYSSKGAKELLFIDWYYIPEFHKDWNLPKDILISFVGSWSPERERSLLSIEAPVQIFGGGWEKSSKNFKRKHGVNCVVLSQSEMSKIFNRSKLNINILTGENRDKTNLRLFEVSASSGLLMTNDNQETRKIFGDDACLYYSELSEVNRLLGDLDKFQQIAKYGQNRVLGSCSFEQRVSKLIEWITIKYE